MMELELAVLIAGASITATGVLANGSIYNWLHAVSLSSVSFAE